MNSHFKTYAPFFFVVATLIAWALLFTYISPTAIVGKVGIQNAYLIAFFLAIICGFSSITGTTFYIAIAALSHGGAHPIVLGLVGGLGLCISDAFFYFIINKGTYVVDKHWKKLSDFIKHWMKKLPEWAVNSFTLVYSAFFPIPNDVLLVTMAIGKRPFHKIYPYLFAGDFISTLLLAYLSR